MTDQIHLHKYTLVVVASGEEAKIFRGSDSGNLQSVETWTPGHLADQGPSGHMPPDMPNPELNEATFSKIIAEKLYDMAHAGKFDELVLVADPDTLGEIRPVLHKEVEEKIILQVDKLLINSPVKDIQKSLAAAA